MTLPVSVAVSGPLAGIQPSRVDVATELNAGWTAQLEYVGLQNIDFDDLATMQITILDGIVTGGGFPGAVTTPHMLARVRIQDEGPEGDRTIFDLIDQTSYRLSTGTLSFPTFLQGTASQIAAAVAGACNVSVSAAPSFQVWKEDVKQQDGWSVLRRLAIIQGRQLYVDTGGVVHYVTGEYQGAIPATFKPASTRREFAPLDRYNKIFVSKALGTGTAQPIQHYDFFEPGPVDETLTTPISFVTPQDLSSAGGFEWLAFWDANDDLIAFHWLGAGSAPSSPDPTGEWPAVKFTGNILPGRIDLTTLVTNVRLRLLGQLPEEAPAGIDVAFAREFGSGRGWPHPFQENMVPSENFAATHWQSWLAEINRGTHTLVSNAPIECRVRLLQSFSRLGKTGRIERVRWSLNGGAAPTVEIRAEVA